MLNANGECVILDSFFESVDSVVEYLEDTGLAHILKEGRIKNLVDYVFGIETGLDSNARKNRSGHVMENMVLRYSMTTISLIEKKCILKNGQTLKEF